MSEATICQDGQYEATIDLDVRARIALDILSHCLDIERGDGGEDWRKPGRDLDKTEMKIKVVALEALRAYLTTEVN